MATQSESGLLEGAIRTITADPAPEGYEFDAWTGDVEALDDASANPAIVTMPAGNVEVTATYRAIAELPTIVEIGFPNYPNDPPGQITIDTDVASDGGGTLLERGICYNNIGNPTIADEKTTQANTIGFITTLVTGLTSGMPYYFTAYATNSAGTTYYPFISELYIP